MSNPVSPPPPGSVDALLDLALAEDLGRAGDITSNATIPSDHTGTGRIVTRAPGRVAGWLRRLVPSHSSIRTRPWTSRSRRCGGCCRRRARHSKGRTRSLLTAERTCLNLLGHLCGVATVTADMVRRIEGTTARIVDTRKTLPGMRALQKYAVRCGGGVNHRFGLDDAVLIKDNHIAAVGSLSSAVKAAREAVGSYGEDRG